MCALPLWSAGSLLSSRNHHYASQHQAPASCQGFLRRTEIPWGQSSPSLTAPDSAVLIVQLCESVAPTYPTLGIYFFCSMPPSLLIFHVKLGRQLYQQVPYFT